MTKNKQKFSDLFIKSLPFSQQKIDYWDTLPPLPGIPGVLGIRTGPKTKSFFILYRVGPRKKRSTLGRYPIMGLSSARLEAQERLKNAFNEDEDATPATFSDLWTEFIKKIDRDDKQKLKAGRRPRSPRTRRDELGRYNTKFKTLHDVPVKDITRKRIAELLEPIADRAPVEANRSFSQLQVMFNRALDLGWIDFHPMYKMSKPGGPEIPRSRVLTSEEIRFIWANSTGMSASVLKLLILTAQRVGEVLSLKWSDLDLEAQTPTWNQTENKTDRPHVLPLSKGAVEILKIQRDTANSPVVGKQPELLVGPQYVFPSPKSTSENPRHLESIKSPVLRIKKEMKAANLATDWVVHDIRRTSRTLLSELHVPEHISELILNHSIKGIQGVYNLNDYLPEKQKGLDTLADHYHSIVK